MKRLRRSRAARLTAQCLSVLLLVPYLLGGLTIRPASAQAEAVDVIVMDFNNRSSIGGSLIGRTAAAALALELQTSERWNPVKEQAVQQELNRLNLRPPFDTIALTRLAQGVDARQVIVGEVLSAKITENPAQATVSIAVQVMDRASQEMINGAVVTGRSAPRIGYTGDTSLLIDEALSNAAFLARQNMERYQLVEGTVLNTSVVGGTYEALVNIGARQGVKDGMRFIVLRGNDLVGRGRARLVDPDFSTINITENFRGVKPEDRCRAVFQLPPPVPRDISDAGGARTVATQGQQPNGQQTRPGDVVVPEVTPKSSERKPSMTKGARLLAGSLILLGIIALAGRRGGTTVSGASAQATTFGTDPAIQVTWSRPSQISTEDVVQYQVVRQSAVDGQCTVGVVIGDAHQFLDGSAGTSASRNLGQIVTTGSGGTGGTGTTGSTNGSAFPACADTALPIVVGRTYTYSIQTVFIPAISQGGTGTTGGTGTGGTTTTGTSISNPSPSSGPVTAIALPTLVAPADGSQQDITNVNFQFMTVAGATTYVVQVSTDASFNAGVITAATLQNADQQGGKTLSTTQNLQTRIGGRSPLFWRVGARNDRDASPPIGGFVFSLGRAFTVAGV